MLPLIYMYCILLCLYPLLRLRTYIRAYIRALMHVYTTHPRKSITSRLIRFCFQIMVTFLSEISTPVTLCQGWQSGSNILRYYFRGWPLASNLYHSN